MGLKWHKMNLYQQIPVRFFHGNGTRVVFHTIQGWDILRINGSKL